VQHDAVLCCELTDLFGCRVDGESFIRAAVGVRTADSRSASGVRTFEPTPASARSAARLDDRSSRP
jgi:hypothetical protein